MKASPEKLALIYYNEHIKIPDDLIQSFLQAAQKHNIKLTSYPKSLHNDIAEHDPPHTTTLAFVLGGDGTYIQASHFLRGKACPLIGVHLGSLGFLTKHPLKNVEQILEKAFTEELHKFEHHWLEVRCKNQTFFALNEVILERGNSPHLLHLELYCEEDLMFPLSADGVIISSSLGSTAYNLAAGGPILHPQIQAHTITPICSHSLTSRPFVIGDNYSIKIQLSPKSQYKKHIAGLTLDGKKECTLEGNEWIEVKKSSQTHISLDFKENNYFARLNQKFKLGDRA